jgi:hypothetical protein
VFVLLVIALSHSKISLNLPEVDSNVLILIYKCLPVAELVSAEKY